MCIYSSSSILSPPGFGKEAILNSRSGPTNIIEPRIFEAFSKKSLEFKYERFILIEKRVLEFFQLLLTLLKFYQHHSSLISGILFSNFIRC